MEGRISRLLEWLLDSQEELSLHVVSIIFDMKSLEITQWLPQYDHQLLSLTESLIEPASKDFPLGSAEVCRHFNKETSLLIPHHYKSTTGGNIKKIPFVEAVIT